MNQILNVGILQQAHIIQSKFFIFINFFRDHVCVHVEGWLDSKYPTELVIDAIQNTHTRKKWDKNVDHTEVIEQIAKNAYIRKTKTKKMPLIR